MESHELIPLLVLLPPLLPFPAKLSNKLIDSRNARAYKPQSTLRAAAINQTQTKKRKPQRDLLG